MPPAVPPIELQPIGHLRTPYKRMEDTPIQTSRNPDEPGRLVVDERYTAALDGLEGFDHAHLICFLDQAWEADGRGTRPFTGDRLVRVVAVRGNEVDFTGVDLLDGTPVLDIKPFAPHLDVPGYTRESGWLAHIRSGWYSQPDAATNPLVSPGPDGLRGMGLDPGPPPRPPTGRPAPRP
jgi:tRNA (adenine37-N6)-methyltransferase